MLNLFSRLHEEQQKVSDDILVVSHLVKKYEDFTAVDDISFSVRKGSLFAFLGLNGAGKSTTINIITGILKKNSGEICIDGIDIDRRPDSIKSEIGIVFQNSVLDPVLTPRENLSLRAGFYNIKGERWKERLNILVDMLDLSSFLDRPVGKLSGGQKRRVDIARAMVHDPKLLILDEPTTGLDPQTRQSVWNLVNSLRKKTGMTVFLTTHYMEEAEKATYVVIMDKGKIIASGTPYELKEKYTSDYVILYREKEEEIVSILEKEGLKYTYSQDGKCFRISLKDATEVLSFLNRHQDILTDFEVEKGDMDDVFLNATGVRKLMEDNENE